MFSPDSLNLVSNKQTHILWIDYSKGIGILLVVYGHVLRGIQSSQIGLPWELFKFPDTIIYSFHMPLFFFLSGLFASKWAQKEPKVALLNKIKSLVYPYFIWSFSQGFVSFR